MKSMLISTVATIVATFALASCERQNETDIYKDVKLEIKAPASINVLETANLEYITTMNGQPFKTNAQIMFMDCDGLTRLGVTMVPNADKTQATFAWTPKCAGKYTLHADFGELAYGNSPSDQKVMDVYGPLITLYTKDTKIKVGDTIEIAADITDYYNGPVLTDVTPKIKCESAPAESGINGKTVSDNGRYQFKAEKDGTYKFIAFHEAYNGIEFWQREVTITVEK